MICQGEKDMFQPTDTAILNHLTEICAIVDFEFRYVYVNGSAAEQEQIPRDKMLGRSILDVHPDLEIGPFCARLQQCLQDRKTNSFKDGMGRWKIKIEPVPEGAFVHLTRIAANKTKVKVSIKQFPDFIGGGQFLHSIKNESQELEMDGWLDALDFRTKETNEHILRVTDMTVLLAQVWGVVESALPTIRHGALLHDIGKTGIPDAILLKSGTLTDAEWDVVRKHPIYAHDLFYPVEYLRNCLPIPYSHHEKWDGTGYPLGLKGEDIPFAARLFALVDVWDTLSHDRVYNKAWPRDKVMEYIDQEAGSHFDPQVVDMFFHVNENPARYSIR
jgi:HD-GYP domain-containing protein (c-di-GMP phosphodiesterase class II)